MLADGQIKDELEQRYIELYRCMIEKDLVSLSAILDDDFVLVHMTGMQQDKQRFLHSIENGILNYYAAEHKAVHSVTVENQVQFIGESRVTKGQELLALLNELAEEKQATPAQISLAWMLCKKPFIIPIPGSRKPERLKENFGAAEIILTAEEITAIDKKLDTMTIPVFGGR